MLQELKVYPDVDLKRVKINNFQMAIREVSDVFLKEREHLEKQQEVFDVELIFDEVYGKYYVRFYSY